MRSRPLLFAAALLAAGSVFAQSKPNFGNYSSITAKRLRAHLEFIANDLLEGRDTPSRGLDIASEYIAAQMKLFGLQPGGVNKTYFQPFPVKQMKFWEAKMELEFGGKKYSPFKDFIPTMSDRLTSGQLVFVGHGFRLPDKGIDPYKGLDVKGKLVVRVDQTPKGWDWVRYYENRLPNAESFEDAALSRGAAGIITVLPRDAYASWKQRAYEARSQRMASEGSDFAVQMAAVTISADLARTIFDGEQASYDDIQSKPDVPSFALSSSKAVSLATAVQEETVFAHNVVAILPGSDPKLKAEYVAVGAHYDHVGVNRDLPGDKIYNGADDDGSGTVALIEMAHALATGPKLKRSVIFVWHAGEEKGLWGSDFFTKNPTVPLASIVTQLNIDMIGRSKPKGNTDARNKMLTAADEIYVIGSRRLSSELGDICADVNKQLLKLNYNYHYDKPNDPESLYERSDHYNYARFGIPIAFFFDGVHEDYHQPGDEPQKIDYGKMERVTRTVCATAWTLANRASRPKVDKKPG